MSLAVFPRQALPVPAAGFAKRGGAGAGPAAISIPFAVAQQCESNWCWAAVSASVAAYYQAGTPWTQCAVASHETGGACCVNGATQQCNQPWWLERALTAVGHLRGSGVGVMAPPLVAAELNVRRPVCLRVEWATGGGNFIAICGMAPVPGDVAFSVTDPLFGPGVVSGGALVNGGYLSSGGRWTHSFVVQP